VCVCERAACLEQTECSTHPHPHKHTRTPKHTHKPARTHTQTPSHTRRVTGLVIMFCVCVCVLCVYVCVNIQAAPRATGVWSSTHTNIHTHTQPPVLFQFVRFVCVCVMCVCTCEHTGGAGGKRSVVRARRGGGNRCGRGVLTWYIQEIVFFRYCVQGHRPDDMAAGVCVCVYACERERASERESDREVNVPCVSSLACKDTGRMTCLHG